VCAINIASGQDHCSQFSAVRCTKSRENGDRTSAEEKPMWLTPPLRRINSSLKEIYK